MKSLLLLILLIGAGARAEDSTKTVCLEQTLLKDSLLRRYLICEHKLKPAKTKCFKEGQRLIILDSSGKKFKGKLKVLNGERLVLLSDSGNDDTIDLDKILMVKRMTLGHYLGGVLLVGEGVFGIVGGILLLIEAQYWDPLGLLSFFAVSAITGGASYTAGGIALLYGNRFYSKKYEFRVIQTKGFELKKKYIKYL